MAYKLAQLHLTPKKNQSTTSDIFISQPDAIKESLAGKLFIVIEIAERITSDLKVINFLIDRLNHNYYQNEKVILRERISTLKVEHIFEAALAKTNTHLNEFIEQEKIKLPLSKINITVGVIHEDELHFANSGKNKVLLIYKSAPRGAGEDTPGEFLLSDITAKAATEPSERVGRLFSDVISGPIPEHSEFLITNETLPEYITNKELIRIISSLPPNSATLQLKNILTKINSYVSFLALIIKSTSLKSTRPAPAASRATTQESISVLNQTEARTENLLTPSGVFSLKKWFSFGSRSSPTRASKSDRTIALKDSIYMKEHPGRLAKKIMTTLKNIFLYIINIIYYLFKLLIKKEKLEVSLSGTKSNITEFSHRTWNKIWGLSKKSKFLLFVALTLLIFFAITTSLDQAQKSKETEVESYAALVELIEKKQNQAEANLLYSNEAGAQELFNEITQLMAELPQVTEEQKIKFDKFKEKFNEQLENVQRVTRFDNPEEVVDYTNLSSRAQPENLMWVSGNNKLYAADSLEKSIYIFESGNNLVTTLTDLEKPITTLHYPALVNESQVYYFNQDSIISLDIETESLSVLAINLLDDPAAFVASDSYNGRLYLLNKNKNQIYRFNRVGQGFSPAYAWIQGGVNLSDTVDLSIDGHIYILRPSGELIKLLRGQEINFKLETVDPPFELATRVFVSDEDKFIYILEPTKTRLVLFDKTGQFLGQYKFPTLTDLKDFAIDEVGKKIFLLNNSKLYRIDAFHLVD